MTGGRPPPRWETARVPSFALAAETSASPADLPSPAFAARRRFRPGRFSDPAGGPPVRRGAAFAPLDERLVFLLPDSGRGETNMLEKAGAIGS